MKIAIVTNLNGIGLQRDWELLTQFLEKDHEVRGVQFDADMDNLAKVGTVAGAFDLVIFLEVIPRNLLDLAPIRWAFLNPEFCKHDVIKIVNKNIDKVFAKTWESKRVLEEAFPGKVFYTGFMSRDQFDPKIPRQPSFLHIGGNSNMRGTQEVLDAWKWRKNGKKIGWKLNVVSNLDIPIDLDDIRIFRWKRLGDAELKHLQNTSSFHIYPSSTEGYGHAIHESLSCGAILLTTAAPPMTEITNAINIKASKVGKICLADIYEVSALDIYDAVEEAMASFENLTAAPMFLAREEWMSNNEQFGILFKEQLAALENPHAPTVAPRKKHNEGLDFAFIGNFKANESTENFIRMALEDHLGHDVTMLQENEVNMSAIRNACKDANALIWVRTPGWLGISDPEMMSFIEDLKIPSISIHLDKFFGIPEREELVGRIPFWKTRSVFTADGSAAAAGFFLARGVHHHWMRPAVSDVYCHPGRCRDEYRCDVGFVGAKDYHKEYPFRRELVEWLEKIYVGRFKHITGIRGHDLNDFYASCKVVVGDCIFAGVPRYWSDRVPETCGRHGLMVHPKIEGLGAPMLYYEPQDLGSLRTMIEVVLSLSHGNTRDMRRESADYTKIRDTWSVRMKEILEVAL